MTRVRTLATVLISSLLVEGAAAEDRPELELTPGWGAIRGQFVLEGEFPAPPPIVRNPPAGVSPVPDERLVVDSRSKGIANIVVWLRKAPAKIHPKLQAAPEHAAVLTVKDARYSPRVLHVRTNQPLKIQAGDSLPYQFNISPFEGPSFAGWVAAPPRMAQGLKFQTASSLPVVVQDDSYHWMRSYLVITDHPYVSITDSDGRFRIEGLPAGGHTLSAWHETAGWIEKQWAVTVPDAAAGELQVQTVRLDRFRR
jgi:hypothetical protein